MSKTIRLHNPSLPATHDCPDCRCNAAIVTFDDNGVPDRPDLLPKCDACGNPMGLDPEKAIVLTGSGQFHDNPYCLRTA